MAKTYKIMELNLDTLIPRIVGDTHEERHNRAGEYLRSLYPDDMVVYNYDILGEYTYKGDIISGLSEMKPSLPLGDSREYVARRGNTLIFIKRFRDDFDDSLYLVCENEDEDFVYHKLQPLE